MRTIKNFGMILLGLALIWLAGGEHPRLLDLRKSYHLSLGEPLEQTTPLVAFTTVALGGFRGIIADTLWLRASRLQEEGKYFELVQLANWITKLEPRFPEVWAYQAWNMTYNISILFTTPPERWRWVVHGIQLLRDEGLRHNPAEASLYWELAWFFQHKIGLDLDTAHAYYKQAWARAMQSVLGGGRPDYAALRSAPADRDRLMHLPGIPELLDALRQNNTFPFRPGWLAEAPADPGVQQILAQHPVPAAVLVNYLRARQLRDVYKMDVDRMQALEEKFAPLDWRSPQAHALYWADRGLDYAEGFERIRLHRMRCQSLRYNFDQGRMVFDTEDGLVGFAADLGMLDPALRAYEEAVKEFPDDRLLREGHQGFMLHAIGVLYRHQEIDRAREWLERLRSQYPAPRWEPAFEDIVQTYLVMEKAKVLDPEKTPARIVAELEQHFIWSKFGETRRAAGHLELAERIYRELEKTAPEVPAFETLQQTAANQAAQVLSRQRVL